MISHAAIKAKAKVLIGLVLAGAFVLLAFELFYWFTHVYENDARVQTDFTHISSQVNGKIETIHVEEGSAVSQGQLLVTLEHEDIRLNLRSLETDLALEQGERTRLQIEREAQDAVLQAQLATQRERVQALEAELRSVGERLALARKDLSRVSVLVGKKLTPEAQLTAEQDKTLVLEGRASFLEGSISVAKRELDQLAADRKKLDIITNNIAVSFVKENRIRDEISKQELLLRHRHITSPIDGIVGEVHRYKGEYVEDGVNILMLHDPERYWIEARVDESQIRHVRVGNEVLIALDAYPFVDFYGRVRHVGSVTTGSAQSDAARGGRLGRNAERVPVRISIDNPPPILTPGMRGNVNIRIYEAIKLWSR